MPVIQTIHENTKAQGSLHFEDLKEVSYRYNEKNYTATIEETENPRILNVVINGTRYPIQIQNDLDLLIEEMGLNELNAKDGGDIFSPMPGLVVDVMVKEGDRVEIDHPLLILEAMKMENIIKASGAGVIEKINAAKGEKIDKGQLLITVNADE